MIVLTPIVLLAAQAVYAPPPPPPITGGRFTCEIWDRSGQRSALRGRLANRRADSDRQPVAELSIDGARGSGLTLTTTVVMKPLQVDFHAYDKTTKIVVSGTIDVGYGNEGRIMLDRRVLDGQGTYAQYVGFCDTQFTTTPEARR